MIARNVFKERPPFLELNSSFFRLVSSLEAFNSKPKRVSFSALAFQPTEIPITLKNGSSRTKFDYYQNYFLICGFHNHSFLAHRSWKFVPTATRAHGAAVATNRAPLQFEDRSKRIHPVTLSKSISLSFHGC
jgi:hypothetical protein